MTASWSKWGRLFEENVIAIFEKYKDEACAKLIVKCLPTSCVYNIREELAAKVGWKRVIVAIGKDYPDVIDLSKMNTNEVVRTIANLGLAEYRNMIEDILYANILRELENIASAGKVADSNRVNAIEGKFHNHQLLSIEERAIIYDEKDWGNTGKAHLTYYFGIRPPEYDFDICNVRTISLRDIGGVSLVLWAMGRLGMAEEIIQFSKYDMATEGTLRYRISDCQNVPIMIESWLFKTYNYIRANVYGKQPLSDEEMRKRFLGQSSGNNEEQFPDNKEIKPIEVPKALSEQVKILEGIGFVPTNIEDDVPF